MSLERNLILSVCMVLVVSLLAGATLTYEHAASKVRTEMNAALAVGGRMVQNAVDGSADQKDPDRRLARIVGASATLVTDLAGSQVWTKGPKQPLSARELDILRLLAQGNTLSEIAAGLGVSYKTIANSCTGI